MPNSYWIKFGALVFWAIGGNIVSHIMLTVPYQLTH